MAPEELSRLRKICQNLTNNDELNTVLEILVNEYTTLWINSNPDEDDLRKEAYFKIATLNDLKEWINENGRPDAN